MISGACILEAKRHDCIMEVAYGSSKSSLVDVIRIHLDLVVATEFAYEGKH